MNTTHASHRTPQAAYPTGFLVFFACLFVKTPRLPTCFTYRRSFIPYADKSDTFSNVWKLRLIRLLRDFRWTVLT